MANYYRRELMSLTYKDSGVDVEAGQKQVRLIKDIVKKTHNKDVLSSIGGFAGLFKLDMEELENPVLVSGTDGVGTKLKLAFMMDQHKTIGEDCVAMCVNDILCQGAKPLFFLDYIATGKLIPEKMAELVEGVANGCKKAGAALIGGETAEMPGFYKENEYDMAGFAVGVVDESKLIDGSRIRTGDRLIGLKSSGLHSNGYSLVREIVFNKMKLKPEDYIEELASTIGEELLRPTRIYTRPIYGLVEKFDIKGICHITGGGFYENIPRMLKDGLVAEVTTRNIEVPKIFSLLQKWGNINREEMYKTFNMGVGMVLVVSPEEEDRLKEYLKELGESPIDLGVIKEGEKGIVLCHQ